jgi:GTPase SAR1 family protein
MTSPSKYSSISQKFNTHFSRESFEKIDSWIMEAKEEGTKTASFLLIGNKADLKADRKVSLEEGLALAEKHGIDFIETSAKDNVNVRETFSKASLEIMKKVNNGKIIVDEVGTQGVKLNKNFRQADVEANREKLHSLKSEYVEESKCGDGCCY